jgi:hypothetical protein
MLVESVCLRKLDRDLLVPLALASLCIALFFGNRVPEALGPAPPYGFILNYDLQSYFLPRYWFGNDELLHGRLPVWNLYEYGGMPFMATTQPAAFYPPKIGFYALFSPSVAHWVFLIFHFLLAALGFLLFCRELELRREAAFVGIAVYLFPSSMLDSNYHPMRMACYAWIPFALLFTSRILRGRGSSAFAGLTTVVALQLHAGYPEFTLHTALFVGVYVFASWLSQLPARPRLAALLSVGGAFLLAGAIASVVLVPLVELSSAADRAGLVRLAVEQREHIEHGHSFWFLPGLLTLPVPVLGLLAIGSAASRKGWPALAILAISLLLLAYGEPLFSFFRIRFRITFFFTLMFVLGWATATGCDAFLRSLEAPGAFRRRLFWGTLAGCAVTFVVYAARVPGSLSENSEALLSPAGCMLALGGIVLLGASVLALMRGMRYAEVFLSGAVVLVLAQLLSFPFQKQTAPFERPGKEGEIKRLLGDRPHPDGRAFSVHDLRYGYYLTDRIPSIFGVEDSFLSWRFRQIRARAGLVSLTEKLNLDRVASMRGYAAAMDLQYVAVEPEQVPSFTSNGYQRAGSDDDAVLLENSNRMGQAWVNYAVHRSATNEEALEYVTGPGFDPRQEVVIWQELKATYPAPCSAFCASLTYPATPARAVRRASPTELEIDVELPRPGVLVVSESTFPGWIATVDGRPAPLLDANFLLRGVELDAGAHTVRFEYRPWSVQLGTWLSLSGLAALASIPIARTLRKKRAMVGEQHAA